MKELKEEVHVKFGVKGDENVKDFPSFFFLYFFPKLFPRPFYSHSFLPPNLTEKLFKKFDLIWNSLLGFHQNLYKKIPNCPKFILTSFFRDERIECSYPYSFKCLMITCFSIDLISIW